MFLHLLVQFLITITESTILFGLIYSLSVIKTDTQKTLITIGITTIFSYIVQLSNITGAIFIGVILYVVIFQIIYKVSLKNIIKAVILSFGIMMIVEVVLAIVTLFFGLNPHSVRQSTTMILLFIVPIRIFEFFITSILYLRRKSHEARKNIN